MRIALVIQSFDPRLGGAEQWTWQFARLLCQRQEEVHVCAACFGPQADELPIVRHQIAGFNSRIGFAQAAAEVLRKLPVDVVHDMGVGWHCDVFQPHGGSRLASFEQNLLLAPAWLRPLKRAVSRQLPRFREFQRLNEGQYERDGRLLLALSSMVARDFQRFHDVPEDRIRVVYNGVDLQRFSPRLRVEHRESVRRRLGVRDDEVLLLIVAHNFPLKGVPTLLRATGQLRREGAPVRLAVAGGKRLGPYQRLAERCGAGPVNFLGSVPDSAPYYAAADVYVQPTFYDPCSLVVLEALASGLPVVTSRFNGAGELMTDGVEGWIVDDPADPEELASRLRVLMSPQVRQACGRAARSLAERHSLAVNCDQVQAVYREVAPLRQRTGWRPSAA